MVDEKKKEEEPRETQNSGEWMLLFVEGVESDGGLGVFGVNPDKQG